MNLEQINNNRLLKKTFESSTDNVNNLKTIDTVNPTFSDKFSWILNEINYNELNDKEIYSEYKQLRQEIYNLNNIVARQLAKI